MANELIINSTLPETRIALMEDGEIQELHIERDSEKGIVGNIYKGKVIRVLPGMQAAFVDIGLEKAAFLYVDDIFFPDMDKPLTTQPLPDPATLRPALPVPVSVPVPRPISIPPITTTITASRDRGDRGRGGRGRDRFRGRDQQRKGPAPLPGTPEDHAMQQREYAKRMLDVEEEIDQFNRVETPSSPVASVIDPGSAQIEGQPEARSPIPEAEGNEVYNDENNEQYNEQVSEDGTAGADTAPPSTEQPAEGVEPAVESSMENFDEFEDEEDAELSAEGGAQVIYRPEPVIDPEAWAEEVAHAALHDPDGEMNPETAEDAADVNAAVESGEVPSTTAMPSESAAAETAGVQPDEGIEPAPGETVETAQEPVSSETGGAGAEEVVEAGPAVAPIAPVPGIPPVRPLAKPIVNLRSAGRPKREEESDEESGMPKRRRRREPVNIADIVKEGQEILVQVAKDPIGTKGARLTCHVSLPGRYLVFMPTVDHIGVSRRIESEGERRRLKETMSRVRPAKTGVIVRTASGKQTDKKLKSDLDYLVMTWNEIQKKFRKQRTGTLVYQDLTIVLRAIRDMFTDEVDKVVVDNKREHRSVMKFVSRFIPSLKDKIELYEGPMPIFDYYGIEPEISRSLDRKVWLKSGGYLVVDQAEALVAIDVNTGRYVGKKTLEETILKTNLEAVKEIAYQLRLRNCGGIIILDLIDMEKESNREKVYKALEEALRKDRARPTILKISQLGLVEMTRKRTRDSMVRSLCEPCAYCEGRGYVKNKLTIAYDIMRDLEREGIDADTQELSIQCHPTVADVLLEDKRDVIESIEHGFNKKITIRSNGAYHVEQYELVAHRGEKNVIWSSDERRQIVRQRVQERVQKIAAEARQQEKSEREQRKKDQREQAHERRRQQEAQRAERREKARQEREAARKERAAVTDETGAAGDSPDEFEQPMVEGEELQTGVETNEAEGASLDTSAEGQTSDESAEGQTGSGEGRRKRRGRRGRGRDRGPAVYIPAIHGAPSGPPPNVKPVAIPVIGTPPKVLAEEGEQSEASATNEDDSQGNGEFAAVEERSIEEPVTDESNDRGPIARAPMGNAPSDEDAGNRVPDVGNDDQESAPYDDDDEDNIGNRVDGPSSGPGPRVTVKPAAAGGANDPRRKRGHRGGRGRFRRKPGAGRAGAPAGARASGRSGSDPK